MAAALWSRPTAGGPSAGRGEMRGVGPVPATAPLYRCVERAERRALVRVPLRRCTERTIVTLGGLATELATVRTRGFAVDDGEYQPDVRCVAAPVFDHGGLVVASLGVSCPSDHLTGKRLGDLCTTVRAAAARVTLSVGGLQP